MAAHLDDEGVLATLPPDAAPRVRSELSTFRVPLPTGIDLHYVVKQPTGGAGRSGAAPLLLVHGYSDSWRSFEELLDAFSPDEHTAETITGFELNSHIED